MATGTVTSIKQGAEQFRGVITYVWCVEFTLDTPSVSGNSSNQDTVTIPGIRLDTDIVLGYTNMSGPSSTVVVDMHVGADNTLHVNTHNASGSPIDPASAHFHVIIGRMD